MPLQEGAERMLVLYACALEACKDLHHRFRAFSSISHTEVQPELPQPQPSQPVACAGALSSSSWGCDAGDWGTPDLQQVSDNSAAFDLTQLQAQLQAAVTTTTPGPMSGSKASVQGSAPTALAPAPAAPQIKLSSVQTAKMFPPFYLCWEAEPTTGDDKDAAHIASLIRRYEEQESSLQVRMHVQPAASSSSCRHALRVVAPQDAKEEPLEHGGAESYERDAADTKFMRRLSRRPAQCVRYGCAMHAAICSSLRAAPENMCAGWASSCCGPASISLGLQIALSVAGRRCSRCRPCRLCIMHWQRHLT